MINLNQFKNGDGATLKGYTPITYRNGFQVSIKDGYFGKDIQKAKKNIEDLKGNCGIWVDNEGNYCIDKSINIKSKTLATLLGKINKQQSIYDWENDVCIYL